MPCFGVLFLNNSEKGKTGWKTEHRIMQKKFWISSKSNVSPAVLSKRLQDFHENDLAEVLPELSSAERSKLYRIFDLDTLSDILEYTDEGTAITYLEEMNLKKAAAILSRIETNVLSDILQHF